MILFFGQPAFCNFFKAFGASGPIKLRFVLDKFTKNNAHAFGETTFKRSTFQDVP
jgi:hypothetical protein